MADTFEFGESIPLTIFLLKNDKPLSGENVTVRVIDEVTQFEYLETTIDPETSEPGEYCFLWTTAPELELNLLVIFTIGTGGNAKTSTEFIQIREAIDDSDLIECNVTIEVSQDIVSVAVVENETVNVNVNPDQVVEIEVAPDQIINIETSQVIAEILVDCG